MPDFFCKPERFEHMADDRDRFTWAYKTDIPHVIFMMYDGGNPYCHVIFVTERRIQMSIYENPETISDKQVVDEMVCPVTVDEMFSASPEAFRMMLEAAIHKLNKLNENGNLRLLSKKEITVDGKQTYRDKEYFQTKLCVSENEKDMYEDIFGEEGRTITDVLAGYILSENVECEYFFSIPFWPLFNLAIQSDMGKKLIVNSIRSIMEEHYYSQGELEKYGKRFREIPG